jgi:hypothetical protein
LIFVQYLNRKLLIIQIFLIHSYFNSGPSIVARALHAFRYKQRQEREQHQRRWQEKMGEGEEGELGGKRARKLRRREERKAKYYSDGVGGGGGGGGGDGEFGVESMTYSAFAAKWGVHHGSCSWCGTEGPKSKK